ncbi:MAG: ABC-ATPase domain-containing protein, partial [bacterium]|nr:ABC-ATPase domain-containing protein [bacterium]
AAPSRLRLRLPLALAGFPASCLVPQARRGALGDFLTRCFHHAIHRYHGELRKNNRGAAIRIDQPGQEVLPRSSIAFTDAYLEARFTVCLPARGRTILGRQAMTLLGETLPAIADHSLRYGALQHDDLTQHLNIVEDQQTLRHHLQELNLVAFIADGAILPRRAGNDDRPLPAAPLVPWESPPSLAIAIDLPHAGRIRGTGIPPGVTLIVGGGYHGKSTLLKALIHSVYDHIPGDGREMVTTHASAVAIRAENGRRVEKVTITPFITDLPDGRSTTQFCSDDASGSTSQAANIVEALEIGARVLLIDEDTSATNFMVRDRRMQELISKAQEPITPFIDRVRQLYDELKVSSILVIGGVGDYLEVADTVIHMDAFRPHDVTERARQITTAWPQQARRRHEGDTCWKTPAQRPVQRASLSPRRGQRENVRAHGVRAIQYGTEEIDLAQVEQVVDASQARYIADSLRYTYHHLANDQYSVGELVQHIECLIKQQGLDVLQPYPAGDRAWARPFEVAAALNRLRTLQIKQCQEAET